CAGPVDDVDRQRTGEDAEGGNLEEECLCAVHLGGGDAEGRRDRQEKPRGDLGADVGVGKGGGGDELSGDLGARVDPHHVIDEADDGDDGHAGQDGQRHAAGDEGVVEDAGFVEGDEVVVRLGVGEEDRG